MLRDLEDTLEERLQSLQHALLLQLQTKLQMAVNEVDRVLEEKLEGKVPALNLNIDKLLVKKHKFARLEKVLNNTIKELEGWQQRFDPTWFLIARVTNPRVDQELTQKSSRELSAVSLVKAIRTILQASGFHASPNESVFVDEDYIKNEMDIAHTANTIAQKSSDDGDFLVDYKEYPLISGSANVARNRVRHLARTLSKSDPSITGLLTCRGVIETLDESQIEFRFLFEVPPGLHRPRGLRTVFQETGVSLDDRFRLAKSLARSILFVHTSGFVHKNIRPETIIVFQQGDSAMGPSFLVGFEKSRVADVDDSARMGDNLMERNFYRHPNRQGESPKDIYVMQHDIYSLGICLLEIGFWSSLLRPRNGVSLPLDFLWLTRGMAMPRPELKPAFLELARTSLPSTMGQTYTEIVTSCLTCLDSEETNLFGEEADLHDTDGILVGVRFIEKVECRLFHLP